MTLEANVLKKVEYPDTMTWLEAEKFASIPTFERDNPRRPEWLATPLIEADLGDYGTIYIKDESVNPGGIAKARPIHELTQLFAAQGRNYFALAAAGVLDGNIGNLFIPTLSVITSGNEGLAIARKFEELELPPPKLIVGGHIGNDILEDLFRARADIYQVNLDEKSLSPEEILKITGAALDITSTSIWRPDEVFYDWLTYEVINEKPDEVYMPAGSHRLWENFVRRQEISVHHQVEHRRDRRLSIPLGDVTKISMVGAEPESNESIADKLAKSYLPFVHIGEVDASSLKAMKFTGEDTGVFKVSEDYLKKAYELMSKHVNCEPSAAAGLALYMQRHDSGLINPRHKIIIINTGNGK